MWQAGQRKRSALCGAPSLRSASFDSTTTPPPSSLFSEVSRGHDDFDLRARLRLRTRARRFISPAGRPPSLRRATANSATLDGPRRQRSDRRRTPTCQTQRTRLIDSFIRGIWQVRLNADSQLQPRNTGAGRVQLFAYSCRRRYQPVLRFVGGVC